MMPLGTVPFGPFVKNEPNGTVPNGTRSIWLLFIFADAKMYKDEKDFIIAFHSCLDCWYYFM